MLVVFALDGQRYALPMACVRRVLRAVAVTPLVTAPAIVLGVVNLGGEVVPVIDMRRRCGHPAREVQLSNHLIVASTARRAVALLVDEALGVIAPPPGDIAAAGEILPDLGLLAGAIKLEDGLVLITDLGRLLSLDEEAAIDVALVGSQAAAGEHVRP